MRDSVSPANRTKKLKSSRSSDAGASRLLWLGLIILAVAALDQWSKLWAVDNLSGRPPLSVIGDFLRFSLVFNEGGAMGTSLGPSTFYLVFSLIVLPLILFYLWKNREYPAIAVPLALISGGAIGNLIDRIRLGRVVDFIDVDFPDISLFGFELSRWWTFNVADAAISCAIVFLFIRLFFQAGLPESKTSPAAQPSAESSENN